MKNYFTLLTIAITTMATISCNSSNSKSSTEQEDSVKVEKQKQDSIREVNERLEQERIQREEQERLEEERKQSESAKLPFSQQSHEDPYNTLVGEYIFYSEGSSSPFVLELTNEKDTGHNRNKCTIYRKSNPSEKINGTWYKFSSMSEITVDFPKKHFMVRFPSGMNALMFPVINENYIYVCQVDCDNERYRERLPIEKINTNNDVQTSDGDGREAQIMNQLHRLGEEGRAMMPQIERLYARQQQAQRQGILSNPDAQFDLNEAIGKLIDIKNKQIELAKELGDEQMIREYEEQRSQIYEAKDKMLYGR